MSILHLFSTPGDRDIRWVVEACRPHLEDKTDPVVAFLPQAWLNVNHWLEYTVRSFSGLARVELIDTEQMDLPTVESVLRKAQVVYISGGNTFLLNHRLQISGLMPYLRKKVQAGLPVVGFSAGMILCGQNILTANDMNSVATNHFDGLQASLFNFYVHYTGDAFQDDWISEYHTFHDDPVIIVSDGAYVKVDGKKTTLVRGEAWVLRRGSEKEKLEAGRSIVPYEVPRKDPNRK